MGTLVIRAALGHPTMASLRHLLWANVSVSGPHAGYLSNSNAAVGAALWLLNRWTSRGALAELALRDAPDWRQSYMFRLADPGPDPSRTPGLGLFKFFVVLASPEDRYVPYFSTRLFAPEGSGGDAFRELSCSLMRQIASGTTRVILCDVHFGGGGVSLDRLVGRKAHLDFVETAAYVHQVVWGLMRPLGVF